MKPGSPNTTLHIYTRVSTTAQEDKGTSLASQEALGRRRAGELGFEARVWNEGGRSSNHEDLKDRPVLYQLVQEMQAGAVKHLFVYDQSRLSRNDFVASFIRNLLQKQGITLYTKDGTYDFTSPPDLLLRQFLDAFAQFENLVRADRTRAGKLARAKQNRWHGGPPVFGYRLEDRRLVVEPPEAEKVKQVFERYAGGESTIAIKAYLDSSGVAPRRGGVWTTGSILKMLSNTHYIGYYSYSDKALKETVRVECPPILAVSLWQAVQERRSEILQRKGQVNRTTHFYLLRDMMFCGDCGSPMAARTRAAKHEHFYYCPQKERQWVKGTAPEHKFSKTTGCSFKRSMNIEQADRLVWEAALKVSRQAKFRRRLAEGIGATATVAANLKKTQKAIKARERELKIANDALVRLDVERRLGRLTAAEHADRSKLMLQERDALLAKLEMLKTETDLEHQRQKWGEWIATWGEEAPKEELTPEERKRYLSGLIERIDVWFRSDTKEHVLELKFARAIAGDAVVKRGSSYWSVPGIGPVTLHARGPAGGKQLTPVGTHSATVE
ncbi:recombinase family protein [Frateuria terrea]|uniref:Site-specific DNA recombinase n=1 Tax=Frateuria terrea TaxID=529704 RepID=A0A1H6VLT3_9GAMM|nr:recombinase family protein [Frateuria terrea]SEJ05599.1 Site-specific DNA recombinase [Frateuria terrea]SFP70953.1 Site-specific DNA recombinase [Frateuria terrea]